MRFIYTIFLYMASPLLILRLWWKGRKLPAYRERMAERFCMGSLEKVPCDVWIHAVSVGEVVAAVPLVEILLQNNYKVLVTTMTPTGSAEVQRSFKNRVFHCYVPYDLPMVLRRFFKIYSPRVGVIFETELWPNMIYMASFCSVSMMLVNGRISDSAFRQYSKLRFFFKPLLNQFSMIFAQSKKDAERFIAMGAASKKVTTAGNIKFDRHKPQIQADFMPELQNKWGINRRILLAVSTHEDEELQLFKHLWELKYQLPDVLLLVAPRHPERFRVVFALSVAMGLKTGLRSLPETVDEHSDVVVVDSMGELPAFYPISDYVFVGGSLVPIGGHNILEPMLFDVPVLTGSYMHNAQSVFDEMFAAGAVLQVKNGHDLMKNISHLSDNPEMTKQMSDAARKILEANRGGVVRYFKEIDKMLTS